MEKIFTRTFRVRWSEVDARGYVSTANYLRFLVETAYDWGSAGQLGVKENKALGLTWVILETEFSVVRPLVYNEIFDFSIWMVEWRRVRGTRAFQIRLQDGGEIIAQGIQKVASLDSETLRPTSPPAHLIENYAFENPRVFLHGSFPKILPAPEAAFTLTRIVEWPDLDMLEHVNNAIYANFAEEAVVRSLASLGWSPTRLKGQGMEQRIRRLHIQYLLPAVWGQWLMLQTFLLSLRDTRAEQVVFIKRSEDGADISACIFEWELVDLHSGQLLQFPEPMTEALSELLQGPE